VLGAHLPHGSLPACSTGLSLALQFCVPAALHVLWILGSLHYRCVATAKATCGFLPWEAAPSILLKSWRGSGTFVCTFIFAICAISTHMNASSPCACGSYCPTVPLIFPCNEIHVSALKFKFCVHAKARLWRPSACVPR